MAADVLQVRGLRKAFGGLVAVDGVDLTVPEGKIVGLIGPNGAGKSTFFDCVAGSLEPDGGTVLLEGTDITGWPAHRVAQHGLVRSFQSALPASRMSVFDNVMLAATPESAGFWRALARRGDADADVARARETIAFFGLQDLAEEYAGHLSGGQRKLLDLARVWMARPRLMLLDEPLAGVAPALRGHIRDRLVRLREAGATILLIEHDLDAVFALADHVVALAQGRVIASGSAAQVRSDPGVREVYLGV